LRSDLPFGGRAEKTRRITHVASASTLTMFLRLFSGDKQLLKSETTMNHCERRGGGQISRVGKFESSSSIFYVIKIQIPPSTFIPQSTHNQFIRIPATVSDTIVQCFRWEIETFFPPKAARFICVCFGVKSDKSQFVPGV
jgi:hypothetical protein